MEKTECIREFIKAADEARSEKYGRAKALVDAIRREEGDREANAMRQEIWRFANMDQVEWMQAVTEIAADLAK